MEISFQNEILARFRADLGNLVSERDSREISGNPVPERDSREISDRVRQSRFRTRFSQDFRWSSEISFTDEILARFRVDFVNLVSERDSREIWDGFGKSRLRARFSRDFGWIL